MKCIQLRIQLAVDLVYKNLLDFESREMYSLILK